MGSHSVIPSPPPGFVREDKPQTPTPPAGFVLEKQESPFRFGGGRFRGAGVSGTWDPEAPTIRARPEPGILERAKRVVTEAIPRLSTRTVYSPKFGQKQFLAPEDVMTPGEQERHPIATGLLEFAGGLTDPTMAAFIVGSGGAGLLPGLAKKVGARLVSAGFAGMMVKGAYDQYPGFKEAMDQGDESESLRIFTHLVASGALATMAGAHAVRGKPLPLRRGPRELEPLEPTPPMEFRPPVERFHPDVFRPPPKQFHPSELRGPPAPKLAYTPKPYEEPVVLPKRAPIPETRTEAGLLVSQRVLDEVKAAAENRERLAEQELKITDRRRFEVPRETFRPPPEAPKVIEAEPIRPPEPVVSQPAPPARPPTAIQPAPQPPKGFVAEKPKAGLVNAISELTRLEKRYAEARTIEEVDGIQAVVEEIGFRLRRRIRKEIPPSSERDAALEYLVEKEGIQKDLANKTRKSIGPKQQVAIEARRRKGTTTLYSNPLVPLGEAYTRLVGRPLWEKGVGLLSRITPDFIQRAMRTRSSLIRERVPEGPQYVEAAREAKGFISETAQRGVELGERMVGKFSKAEQQALGRLLKGEANEAEVSRMRIDPKWNNAIEAVKAARAEFDNLGNQAVLQGLLKEETFFRNYGKYMPRLYRKYEIDYDGLIKQFREKKPTRIEGSRFKKREDIPEEVRMMMGEILEPGLPVAKGIAQIGHDIGVMRLFNAVAGNPKWSGRSLDALYEQGLKPSEFVQMPTTPKLGKLSGSWVNKYIAEDLNQIIRSRTEMNKLSRAIIGEWKFFKVVLNPATHGRNLMSNTILAHLGGLPMTRVDIYFRALRELKDNGPLYQEAKTASQGRMGRGTFAAAEFDMLLDSWNKSRGSLTERFASMSKSLKEGKPSEAFGQIRVSRTGPGRKAAELYQAEEQWFKLAKYLHNKEKGMAPKEAWVDAESWLFDYSDVPKFIDWSRQSPLGAPFVTFTYKALPMVAKSIVETPWRMGAILGTLHYFNQEAAKEIGLSEAQRKELESILPERMRGKVLGINKHVILPFRDKYGQVLYLDLTYILPWGDIGEAGGLGQDIPGIEKLGGLSRQLPGLGSPLVQTIAEIGLNRSSFTGRNIYESWETTEEKSKKVSLYLWRQVAPTLAPGGYGATRLGRAITKEPDYRGRTSSLPTAAASTLLGLKTTPIDPRQERKFRRFERESQVRDIQTRIRSVQRNRGLKVSEKAKEIRRLRQIQVEIIRARTK